MIGLKDGIMLSRAEIAALIEFTSSALDQPTSRARFVAAGDTLRAHCSDGVRALEVAAPNNGLEGEWLISRAGLSQLKRTLGGGDMAKLVVEDHTISRVVVTDAIGAEVAELRWTDEASAQMSFPEISSAIRRPGKGRPVSAFRANALLLASLSTLVKAANSSVLTMHIPTSDQHPILCEVRGDEGTWTSVIMPTGAPDAIGDTL